MKKLERILNNLEKALSYCFVSIIGIFVYLFLNYESLSINRLIVIAIVINFLILISGILMIFYNHHFHDLKD